MQANAGIIKSIASKASDLFNPAVKAAKQSEGNSSSSKMLKKYIGGQDIQKSNLDQIKVYALSSGGDESQLKELDMKFVELEFRAMDIVDNLDDALKRGAAYKRLMLAQFESLNILLAHLHVTVRKQNNNDFETNLFNVMTLLNDELKNIEVSGMSFQLRPILDFQRIGKRVIKDLNAEHIKLKK